MSINGAGKPHDDNRGRTIVTVRNARGKVIDVTLPLRIVELARDTKSDVVTAYATLGEYRAGQQEAKDDGPRLQAALEQAEAERANGIRQALAKKKPLPTEDPTVPVRAQLDLARSRVDAFQDLIAAQSLEVLDAFERDRPKLAEAASAQAAKAEEELAASLDAYVAARAAFVAALEDERFVVGFPDEKMNWDAQSGSIVMAPVDETQRLAVWDNVEQALRQDADRTRRMKRDVRSGFRPLQPMPVPARDEDGRAVYGPPTVQPQGVTGDE